MDKDIKYVYVTAGKVLVKFMTGEEIENNFDPNKPLSLYGALSNWDNVNSDLFDQDMKINVIDFVYSADTIKNYHLVPCEEDGYSDFKCDVKLFISPKLSSTHVEEIVKQYTT